MLTIGNKIVPLVLIGFAVIAGVAGAETYSNKNPKLSINTLKPSLTYQPLKIRQTNIRDTKFTISWYTSIETTGYLRYGDSPLTEGTAYDDRGEVVKSKIHYVTVRNLRPNTLYYYKIISGNTTYQNNGVPYSITTAPSLIAAASDVAYGRIFSSRGIPYTKGAIVYLTLSDKNAVGSAGLSDPVAVLVDENGYYSYEVKNFREGNLRNLFRYSEAGDELQVEVQAQSDNTLLLKVGTKDDSPVKNIIIPEIKGTLYEAY